MYFLYILKNSHNILYIGVSTDVQRRLKEHNSGRGAHLTFRNCNFKVVFTQGYENINEAYSREKQLKGWCRAKKEALIVWEM